MPRAWACKLQSILGCLLNCHTSCHDSVSHFSWNYILSKTSWFFPHKQGFEWLPRYSWLKILAVHHKLFLKAKHNFLWYKNNALNMGKFSISYSKIQFSLQNVQFGPQGLADFNEWSCHLLVEADYKNTVKIKLYLSVDIVV